MIEYIRIIASRDCCLYSRKEKSVLKITQDRRRENSIKDFLFANCRLDHSLRLRAKIINITIKHNINIDCSAIIYI